MPPKEKTLGHGPAMAFAQAVLDQQWSSADSLFLGAPLADQGHMISVASDIGGSPGYLNPWVSGGSEVGQLLRGATRIVRAWDQRSGVSVDQVAPEVVDEFHSTLEAAESDLFAAADAMPHSSIPWQHLLTSGRGLRTNRIELDDRYVKHIERGELLAGHMSFQQLISKKWAGSNEEMWEHAEWATRSAAPGSPKHALVAIALIESHIKPDVRHDNVRQLPSILGKDEIIDSAARNGYEDEAFDAETPAGAMALSAWFTLHYIMGNWDAAAELIPRIGNRFTRFPMSYFQSAAWPEIQQYVSNRLVRAA